MNIRKAKSSPPHQPAAAPHGAGVTRGGSASFVDRRKEAAAQRKLNNLANLQYSRRQAVSAPAHGMATRGGVVQGYFLSQPGSAALGTVFESQSIRREAHSAAYETSRATVGNLPGQEPTEDPVRGLDSTTTRHHDQASMQDWQALPNMKISDGRKLAIGTMGQAKEFFALPGTAASSNAILAGRGAKVRLKEDSGSVTVPGSGATLARIVPARAVPPDLTHPDGLEQISELTNHLCNNVIEDILGSARRVITLAQPSAFGGEDKVELGTGNTEPVKKIAGYLANTASGQIDRSQVGSYQENNQASADYLALPDQEKSARASLLGINEFAQPGVGEGYVTRPLPTAEYESESAKHFSLEEYQAALAPLAEADKTIDIARQQTSAKIQGMRNIWKMHYAGVVARDGGDSVTLENYNRTTEVEWELLRIFNNLFADFEEFRNFVATKTQTLPAAMGGEDTKATIAEACADALVKGEQLTAEYRMAIEAAQHTVKTSLAYAHEHAVTMMHFQMYGSQPGQSFHEQLAGTNFNAVTLRTEESLAEAKRVTLAEIQGEENQVLHALQVHGQTNTASLSSYITKTGGEISALYTLYSQLIASSSTSPELQRNNVVRVREVEAALDAKLLHLYLWLYQCITGKKGALDKTELQRLVGAHLQQRTSPDLLMLQALMLNT